MKTYKENTDTVHTIGYCELCEINTVIYGNCGMHTCSGSYGEEIAQITAQ